MTPDHWDPVILASYLTLAGDVAPEVRPGSQVSRWDVAERIEAASAAGYRGIGFADQDLAHWTAVHGTARIRRWLDDAGIAVVELEMLHDWYAEGADRAASDALAQRLLTWSAELGARHVKVGTGFAGRTVDRSRLVAGLAELGAKAADVGVEIALEPMPPANVRTPQEGLALIEEAAVPNAGLLIDIWHVYRAGVDYDTLREIPARRITSIELVDGAAEPVAGDLFVDGVDHRRLAGTGAFDVDRFLEAIFATGFRGPIGDEAISIENRARSLREAAEANYAATAAAVARARPA